MCQILHLADRDIESLGQIRQIFHTLVNAEGYTSIPKEDDLCLCQVDLIASGKANGVNVVLDEYGD
jgi:hypothetical protein